MRLVSVVTTAAFACGTSGWLRDGPMAHDESGASAVRMRQRSGWETARSISMTGMLHGRRFLCRPCCSVIFLRRGLTDRGGPGQSRGVEPKLRESSRRRGSPSSIERVEVSHVNVAAHRPALGGGMQREREPLALWRHMRGSSSTCSELRALFDRGAGPEAYCEFRRWRRGCSGVQGL